MIHEIISVGPLQCNCSILGDEATQDALVVDPGADIEDILDTVANHGLTVKAIYITHAHIDHIGGAMKLKQRTGAPIHMHKGDTQQLGLLDMQAQWIGMPPAGSVTIDQWVKELDRIRFGEHAATVLYTPGHTEGSTCLFLPEEKKLIAGDTLFAGSIGRTDLPGGDFKKIIESLHGKLMELPDNVIVVPGHGGLTTIGEEREANPFITDNRFRPKIQEG
ncbi:MAG: MBL fold metallo-hydrolase [Acidobacteriales bacterium]|nr:MBL fold metallo-hydrolase [Terriglobales bacterium]